MNTSRFLASLLSFIELTRWILTAIVVIVLIIVFVGLPLPVSGESMEPNFQNSQIVMVEHITYQRASSIKRGDVVATRFPADPSHTKLIKRVVGLPGETVYALNGQIYVNGQALDEAAYNPRLGLPPYSEASPITLKTDEYFLAGDNRPGSSDSRLWGPVQKSDIQGRISFIVWPLKDLQYISRLQ